MSEQIDFQVGQQVSFPITKMNGMSIQMSSRVGMIRRVFPNQLVVVYRRRSYMVSKTECRPVGVRSSLGDLVHGLIKSAGVES